MPMLVTPGPPSSADAPADDHHPALSKDAFDCPRCGAYAHQQWKDIDIPEGHQVEGGGWATDFWRIALCTCCGKPSVWRNRQMVYPLAQLGSAPHPDMPDGVRALYEEAAAVAVVSRRAGAALARATLELLIKRLDPDVPDKANLVTRIARIKQRGVSTSVGQMLDVVRVAGNGALHVDDQPGELVVMALDDQEGPQLLELFLEVANDLVDEFITKPKTTRELWDKLPPGVKAQLEPASTPQGNADAPGESGGG